ncbi:GntR family transcriptional regulator [Streptomyces sp. UH6]|uniref:GntR family transcriptional regulator n=1 Tax=Streptomyces sp. UH6 TaxID=2748379 RepID=UPI0015D4A31F|nr:GntR family transcriptional regulator [Streptomyces sp. UH6]NYV74982.1 GntR family transcriptional regulator [Streptomyces sp. UH6]
MTPAKSDRPDRRPPYQHAAEAIRKEIRAGRLKPGEQLPSLRELQDRFGIANMTMRAALNLLREEGLIYTIQGRGSFVADVGELPDGYTAPAWYLAGSGAEGEEDGTTLTEVLTSLRDEVRHLSAEHQDLKREVEELKARVHANS